MKEGVEKIGDLAKKGRRGAFKRREKQEGAREGKEKKIKK